jgi:hypothetical protein
METGYAAGTAVTLANSDDNGAGFAWTPEDAGTGTVQTSTTSPLFGTRSVAFAAPVTGDYARGSVTGLFSTENLVLDLAFRTPTLPDVEVRLIEVLAATVYKLRISVLATGQIKVYNAAGVGVYNSTALIPTASTGWRLGLRIVAGTTITNGRLELRYYSNATATTATETMTTITAGDFGIVAFDQLRFGKVTSAGVWGLVAADGVQISDTRTTLFDAPPSSIVVSAGVDLTGLEPWNPQTLTATTTGGTATWSQVSGPTTAITSTGANTATYTYKPVGPGNVSLTFRAADTGVTDDVVHTFLPARDWIVVSTNQVVRTPIKIRRVILEGVNATYDTTAYDTNPYG